MISSFLRVFRQDQLVASHSGKAGFVFLLANAQLGQGSFLCLGFHVCKTAIIVSISEPWTQMCTVKQCVYGIKWEACLSKDISGCYQRQIFAQPKKIINYADSLDVLSFSTHPFFFEEIIMLSLTDKICQPRIASEQLGIGIFQH